MDAAAPDPHRRAFAAALDDLDEAMDRFVETGDRIRERLAVLREQLDAGGPVRDIVSVDQPPQVVHLLTDVTQLLHTYGNRVRRTEARVLHEEGLTMEEIARIFGVTRQRVSALLRDPRSAR